MTDNKNLHRDVCDVSTYKDAYVEHSASSANESIVSWSPGCQTLTNFFEPHPPGLALLPKYSSTIPRGVTKNRKTSPADPIHGR